MSLKVRVNQMESKSWLNKTNSLETKQMKRNLDKMGRGELEEVGSEESSKSRVNLIEEREALGKSRLVAYIYVVYTSAYIM